MAPSPPPVPELDPRRLVATHVAQRVPVDRVPEVVACGLQDTAPRAGLLSLHARIDDVEPDSWADDRLVQVWGPRHATYIVPADARASFTLGRMPRDAAERAVVLELADRVTQALDGEPVRSNELAARLGLSDAAQLRSCAISGRFVIQWDTRTTWIVPVDAGTDDEESARRDLARRHLEWFGSSGGADGYARWAGVSRADALATWETLELEPAESIEATLPDFVRLLPPGDPVLYGLRLPDHRPGRVAGAVVIDGEIVASWTRRQLEVAIHPYRALSGTERERLDAELSLLRGPLGSPVAVRVGRNTP